MGAWEGYNSHAVRTISRQEGSREVPTVLLQGRWGELQCSGELWSEHDLVRLYYTMLTWMTASHCAHMDDCIALCPGRDPADCELSPPCTVPWLGPAFDTYHMEHISHLAG